MTGAFLRGVRATCGPHSIRKRLVVTVVVGVMVVAAPGIAQQRADPMDPIIDFFQAGSGRAYESQFSVNPMPGVGSVSDPVGDLEHPTGQRPAFTPAHIDIVEAWAAEFDPGPIDLFGPTDAGDFWAPTGQRLVEPPNHAEFATYTGDQIHDGSQYDDGALLFGFTLAATPPFSVVGRCELVVWINDLALSQTFVNHPLLPGDPAGGTNLAFGLALNPADQGPTSTFALRFAPEVGEFEPDTTADIRSFVTPDFVGITVPKGGIGELAAVNFYTFCANEGVSFEPEDSGADQTGPIDITESDLGRLIVTEPVVTTTTTTEPEAATTTRPIASSTARPSEPDTAVEDEGTTWWPWMLALPGIAVIAWRLLARGGGVPCEATLHAWTDAREACSAARDAASAAARECKSSETTVADLEAARKGLCREWPPACWSTPDGGWVEDDRGRRFTAWDVHMRKVALREVWSAYRAGELGAAEVEARWAEVDTPQLRANIEQLDREYKARLQDLDREIETARQALGMARLRADEAETEAERRCDAATVARQAHDNCIKDAGRSV